MPLSSLGNISPYEKLYGTPPINTHLRTFGCLCFVSTIKQQQSKFHARASPCIFVGYPCGQKGYKLYDIESKKILVSCNVHFHEHHFPYHITSPSPSFKFYLPASTAHPFPYDIPISTPPASFTPSTSSLTVPNPPPSSPPIFLPLPSIPIRKSIFFQSM